MDAAAPDTTAPSRAGTWQRLRHRPKLLVALALLAVLTLMALWPQLFTRQDPRACFLARSLDPPSLGHPFGFDFQGCDYFARTIHGARTSLVIGVAVVGAAAALAVVFGSIAGYFGGFADRLISRIADIWVSVPLVLGGMFFLSLLEERGLLQVTIVLTVLGAPAMIRLMRSSVLQTTTEEYVEAARALGASDTRILVRHVVPNSLRPLVGYAALYTATAISAEAILSFMGIGLQLPTISWGQMLGGSAGPIPGRRLGQNPHLLLPGAFLALAIFAFVLLAESLRDSYDPQEAAL